jgi:hypothetical protein
VKVWNSSQREEKTFQGWQAQLKIDFALGHDHGQSYMTLDEYNEKTE